MGLRDTIPVRIHGSDGAVEGLEARARLLLRHLHAARDDHARAVHASDPQFDAGLARGLSHGPGVVDERLPGLVARREGAGHGIFQRLDNGRFPAAVRLWIDIFSVGVSMRVGIQESITSSRVGAWTARQGHSPRQ